MCGIVGLHLKNPGLQPRLGELLTEMLEAMTTRGPDSAGIAVYTDHAPAPAAAQPPAPAGSAGRDVHPPGLAQVAATALPRAAATCAEPGSPVRP